MSNLYANMNMVTHDDKRWPIGYHNLPSGIGKIKDLSRLDADFFGISEKNAHLMDAQNRIMLEVTYEAICDAGIDPNSLSGTNTGVFIGEYYNGEAFSAQGTELTNFDPYYQTFVGTVSQAFNLKGPALCVNTACASGFNALQEAIVCIKKGLCERCLVIGVNISLNPTIHKGTLELNMTSLNGISKCLDANADGYVKGEACVAVVIQKKSDAKRNYGTIVHSKTNTDGYTEYGLTFPNHLAQKSLMIETYAEAGIDPLDVNYVEAHCTGTPAGDPVEMDAIVTAMCKERTTPLLIGAVKSNIGHTEAASGLCSLIKVLLSFENQCIPANINYKTPNPKIEGLRTGVLKPIIENTPFYEKLAALNCFGFGGVNCHSIVRSDSMEPKSKNSVIFDDIPRLVMMCGRTEEGLSSSLKQIIETPKMLTRDYLSLLNQVSKTNPFKGMENALGGMNYRGFTLIDNKNTDDSNKIIVSKVGDERPPLWFVFSGLETQWLGMAESLMSLSVFSQSIQKSAQVLSEYKYDLLNVLISTEVNPTNCPLNALVSLAAIQIGLVDVLNHLDIFADGFIGHSVGELGCAYADQCLTHEETIRVAFWRGWCVKQEFSLRGRMAAIDMNAEESKTLLPSGVFIACYDSDDSVTVSGNETKINSLIEQLKTKKQFVRPVDSTGIAFHCPLMSTLREPLVKELSKIITSERKLTKWLSTSYEISDNRSQHLTPEYMADNLIEPVLFSNALKTIAKNAVVLEVSPNSLFQSIITRNLGSDVKYIPLMKKNEDNIRNILESVGKLYSTGINPSIENLYPKVEYPVSRGTPTISSLIKWDHNKAYTVYKYPEFFNSVKSQISITKINLKDTEYSYLMDHCLDGRVLFPATGYLYLAWKHLANQKGIPYYELPVEFEDVRFHRATILSAENEIKFTLNIDEKSGQFVITESSNVCVTGRIFLPQMPCIRYDYLLEDEFSNNGQLFEENNDIILRTEDFYKYIGLRGYDYGKQFQCLSKVVVKSHRIHASLKWKGKWAALTDSILHTIVTLSDNSQNLLLPVRIRSLRCDPVQMTKCFRESTEDSTLPFVFDKHLGIGVTRGLEISGLTTSMVSRKLFSPMQLLECLEFVEYEGKSQIENSNTKYLKHYINKCNQIAIDLSEKFKLSLNGFQTNNNYIKNVFDNIVNTTTDGSPDEWLLKTLIAFKSIELKGKIFDEILLDLDNLNKDVLNHYTRKEYFVRPLIETVVENVDNIDKTLNVLEITQSTAIIAPIFIEMIGLTLWREVNTKYNLLHPNVEQMTNLSDYNVQAHNWDIRKSVVPEELNSYELIIYEDRMDLMSLDFNVDLKILFDSVWNSVKNNGFLIVFYRNQLTFAEQVLSQILNPLNNNNNENVVTNEWLTERKNQIISEAKSIGFTLIATKNDGFSKNASIFRKFDDEIRIERQTFIRITNHKCEQWIEKLKHSLKMIEDRPQTENIWLVGNDGPTNGIIGLVNSLRTEPNGHRIRCIFQCDSDGNVSSDVIQNETLMKAIVKKNLFMNVFKSSEIWGAFRRFPIDMSENSVPTEHCFINVETRGDLSSFKWFEAQHKYWPLAKKYNQQLIKVVYSALNFKDIMYASGKLSLPDHIQFDDCVLGLEFSGTDESGQRVFGITYSKGLSTSVVVNESDLMWPIPEHWSMEDAATVPIVYSTAYLALIMRGKLQPKETVLIHSGSGGVGMAAISICLSMDCKLLITCGSKSKREFLKQEFSPKLCDENFCTSRDMSFETFVMKATNGRGVDVVLNSLSEDKLKASVRCLATNGRFLEIGKYDMTENNDLETTNLIRNKSFHAILLELYSIENIDTKTIKSQKRQLKQLLVNGIRDGTVRPLKRTVFDGSQVEQAFRFMASGKHMGKVVLKMRDEKHRQMTVKYPSVPRTVFKPNLSYIITGGLGGFGLELADWMVRRGVINLVLTSRTGLKTPYQMMRIKQFQDMGVNVRVFIKDVSDLSQTRDVIKLSTNMCTSQGVGGVFNLAMVLADGLFTNQTAQQFETVLGPKSHGVQNLDTITRELCPQLEYFVCFSSTVCSVGQMGLANYGFANSIMERICDQRRASGLPGKAIEWGVVGDVGVVHENRGDNVNIAGSSAQRLFSCLAALDVLLQSNHTTVLSCVKANYNSVQNNQTNVFEKIENILGVKNYSVLDPKTSLIELGIDSLISVEIKQMFERNFDIIFSADEIRGLTVGQISAIVQKNHKNRSKLPLKAVKSDFNSVLDAKTHTIYRKI